MNTTKKLAAVALMGLFCFTSALQAQDKVMMDHMEKDHIMLNTSDLKWVDGPGSLPAGCKMAVLEGNPGAEGLFTIRLKFPANYVIKPHTHPADEHITLIEGSLFMGMGEKYDPGNSSELKLGSFGVMMKGTKHFAFTKKESIVQLHGMGPWGIIYVNPDDDPRNMKKTGMDKGE